jgi:hypothetical protein
MYDRISQKIVDCMFLKKTGLIDRPGSTKKVSPGIILRECSLFIPGVGTEEKWVG